jgi:hypothetical protein
LVHDDPLVIRSDSYVQALKDLHATDTTALIPVRSKKINSVVNVIFTAAGGKASVLSPKGIAAMRRTQTHVTDATAWSRHCLADVSAPLPDNHTLGDAYEPACSQRALSSIIAYFDDAVTQGR